MQKEWLQCKPRAELRSRLEKVVVAIAINIIVSLTNRDFTLQSEYLHFARRAVEVLAQQPEETAQTNSRFLADMFKVHFYLGRVARLLREDAIAAYLYKAALVETALAVGENHIWMVWIHKNLALIYGTNGAPIKALHHLRRAIAIAEGNLRSEVRSLRAIENDFNVKSVGLEKPSTFTEVQDSISPSNIWTLLLNATTLHTLDLPSQRTRTAHRDTRGVIPQRLDNCHICRRAQLGFKKDWTERISASRKGNYRRDIHAVEVHFQVCMFLMLGNLYDAWQLYCRATGTHLKTFRFEYWAEGERSPETLTVGLRIFGKFFKRD